MQHPSIDNLFRAGKPIKNLPETVTVGAEEPSAQLFQRIADAAKFPVHRLRITKGSDGSAIANSRSVTVHQTGLRNKSAVDVKDLGAFSCPLRHVTITDYA